MPDLPFTFSLPELGLTEITELVCRLANRTWLFRISDAFRASRPKPNAMPRGTESKTTWAPLMESQDAINNLPLVHTNSSSSLYSSLCLNNLDWLHMTSRKVMSLCTTRNAFLISLKCSKDFITNGTTVSTPANSLFYLAACDISLPTVVHPVFCLPLSPTLVIGTLLTCHGALTCNGGLGDHDEALGRCFQTMAIAGL